MTNYNEPSCPLVYSVSWCSYFKILVIVVNIFGFLVCVFVGICFVYRKMMGSESLKRVGLFWHRYGILRWIMLFDYTFCFLFLLVFFMMGSESLYKVGVVWLFDRLFASFKFWSIICLNIKWVLLKYVGFNPLRRTTCFMLAFLSEW